MPVIIPCICKLNKVPLFKWNYYCLHFKTRIRSSTYSPREGSYPSTFKYSFCTRSISYAVEISMMRKATIMASTPELRARPVFIIPLLLDYSIIQNLISQPGTSTVALRHAFLSLVSRQPVCFVTSRNNFSYGLL